MRELSDSIELDKNQAHNIEVVVDRLIKKPGLEERLTDSLTTCLRRSEGIAVIELLDVGEGRRAEVLVHPTAFQTRAAEGSTSYIVRGAGEAEDRRETEFQAASASNSNELVFSENFACPEHGAVMEELSPRLFSFNSPYGACPNCHGLGSLQTFSPELVVPDPQAPVYAAIAPWSEKDNSYYLSWLYSLGQAYGFEIQSRWNHLTPEQQNVILYGADQPIWVEELKEYRRYAGVIPMLQRQYSETTAEQIKQKLEQYVINQPCEVCQESA